ncbi:hypothetical protein ABZ468_39430 [Streptomyces sp. NPDC005708]|uniref:hypothetical protein n=1 Tax=unclassified Streptomyces TaxID=2593676 RepID=UPI0034083EDC
MSATDQLQPGDQAVVVSHYDEDKSALLGRCLVPIALRLQAGYGTAPCYLERHWFRGPHIRLVVPGSLPGGVVMEEVVAPIRAYLTRHPSTTPLVTEDYLRLSEELGRAELVRPPYGPLRPDNTVSVEDQAAQAQASTVLIGESGYRLKQLYLTQAVRPLEAALAAVGRGAHRAVPAFQALVANAARWPVGGLVTGQLSYRSHLEDFLANDDGDGRIRARFEDQFGRTKAKFARVLAEFLENSTDGVYTGADPCLRAWTDVFDTVWPRVLAAAERRDFEEDLGPGYLDQAGLFDPQTERQWRFGSDRPSSEFHAQLGKLNFLDERVNVVPFAAYRFLTNNLTRWLPLLDVPPIERYFLSYAVSELVESHFGTSWRTQFEQIRTHGRLAPEASS